MRCNLKLWPGVKILLGRGLLHYSAHQKSDKHIFTLTCITTSSPLSIYQSIPVQVSNLVINAGEFFTFNSICHQKITLHLYKIFLSEPRIGTLVEYSNLLSNPSSSISFFCFTVVTIRSSKYTDRLTTLSLYNNKIVIHCIQIFMCFHIRCYTLLDEGSIIHTNTIVSHYQQNNTLATLATKHRYHWPSPCQSTRVWFLTIRVILFCDQVG